MAQESRRLAAIMLTDLVGFTAQTREDETGSLALLEEHRGIVRTVLHENEGREIKTIGDGFLVEFESTIGAVQSAIQIQRLVHARNVQPHRSPIRMRIGVHVGDVIHRNGDVYGDCVNQVSRIEPLAEPGGICVSGPVYEQVRHQLRETFAKLDTPHSKDGLLPVEVYRVILPWEGGAQLRLGAAKLVGRTVEWDQLRSLIDRAIRREGGVVFVGGEAGIGKSRLAEQALSYATRQEMTCLQARCATKTAAVPYGPWSEMLREFSRGLSAPYLSKIAADSTEALTKLVPELRERLGPSPTVVEPVIAAQERVRFLDHLSQIFLNIAREAPLLVLVEDLQFADEGSADLLEIISRKARGAALLFIGNYRDSEVEEKTPFERLQFTLHANRLSTMLSLRRLDRKQVAELIQEITGDGSVNDEFRDLIYDKTGGNPYFVEEVLQSLAEEGTIFPTEKGWDRKPVAQVRLPRTVRELLRQRLGRLDEDTRSFLRVGAVVGTEFTFERVREVAEVDEERGVSAIENALRLRLIGERELGPGRVVYQFADRQIRDVLYEDISLVRAQSYHRRVAQVLEKALDGSADELAGEIAYHYLRGNERTKALEFSIRAGDRASHLFAHQAAERHYQVALGLLDEHPDELARCQVLEKLGDEEKLLANPKQAVRHWEEGARGYERLGRRIAAAALLYKVGEALAFEFMDRPRAIQFLNEARTLLEKDPDPQELAQFYTKLAWVHSYWQGTRELVQELGHKAASIGRELNSPEAEIFAYDTLSTAAPANQRREAVDLLRKALEVAVAHRSEFGIITASRSLGSGLLQVNGDFDQALPYFEQALELIQRAALVGEEMHLRGALFALTFIRMGRLTEARQAAEELYRFAAEHLPRRRWADLCVLGEALVLQKDLKRAQEVLGEWDTLPKDAVPWFCQLRTNVVLAELDLALGRDDAAERHLEIACDLARRQGYPARWAHDVAKALAILVACHLNRSRETEGRERLEELERLAQEFNGEVVSGFSWRAEGLWAAAHGDWDKARRDLEQSVVTWERLRWPYEIALSQFHLGNVLALAGEHASAAEAKKRALEGFVRIGAKLGADRVSADPDHPIT